MDSFLDDDLQAMQADKTSFLAAMLRHAKADVTKYMSENSTRPFHYGTHYSTSAIVLHYLVRLQDMRKYMARITICVGST